MNILMKIQNINLIIFSAIKAKVHFLLKQLKYVKCYNTKTIFSWKC